MIDLLIIVIILFITLGIVAYKHGEKIAEFMDKKGPRLSAFQKMFGIVIIIFCFIILPFYWKHVWGDPFWKPIIESKILIIISLAYILFAMASIIFLLKHFNFKIMMIELAIIIVVSAGSEVIRFNWSRIKEFAKEMDWIEKEAEPLVLGATESHPLAVQFSDTLFLKPNEGQWVRVLPSDICCRPKIVGGKLVTNEHFKNKRLDYFKAGVLGAKLIFKIVCKDGIHSQNCPNGYYVEDLIESEGSSKSERPERSRGIEPVQPKKEEPKVIVVEPNQTQELELSPKEKKVFWRSKEEKRKLPQTNNYDTTIYKSH